MAICQSDTQSFHSPGIRWAWMLIERLINRFPMYLDSRLCFELLLDELIMSSILVDRA